MHIPTAIASLFGRKALANELLAQMAEAWFSNNARRRARVAARVRKMRDQMAEGIILESAEIEEAYENRREACDRSYATVELVTSQLNRFESDDKSA